MGGGRKPTPAQSLIEQLEDRVLLSAVVARMLFYNDSLYDNDNPAINAADDAAVATDKQALGELGHATFVNYSSYDKGINGLMIDIDNVPGTPTLADFVFRAGNSGDPFSWPLAPAPTGFFMRNDQGAGGADRIEFTWDASSAVKNQWLQVTVLPTSNTGLYQQDTFYFGSAIGETGNSTTNALVNLADYGGVFSHFSGFSSVGVDSPYDINRDGRVNLADSGLVLANQSGFSPLNLISTPINPAGHLQSEVFSGHEVRLTWQDQSSVEAGYQVSYATYPDKTFKVFQTLGANRTGTLITGLEPHTGYWFKVTAIASATAGASSLQPAETNASAPQPRAPTLLLMTPADGGDGPTTYEINLPDFDPAKGEASYSASGSLALNDDQPAIDDHTVLVQAYSEEAAIAEAFQGTITITNGDNQTHDYQFSDGAFDYGTVDALYARHNTADAPFDRPSGLSGDDYAIVLEDSYQWTDIDKDYDDFYWKVNVNMFDALDVDKMQDNQPNGTLSDDDQNGVGAFVPVNNDDDDYADYKKQGFGSNDFSQPQSVSIPDEDDLLPIKLHKITGNDPGNYTLTLPSGTTVWRKADRTELLHTGDPIDASSDATVYVEGVFAGSGTLTVNWSNGNQTINGIATAKITVFNWSGALNVPGYGTYEYKASGGLESSKWLAPSSGTIMGEGSISDAYIKWDGGPVVGKAIYQINDSYQWDLEVNVVHIQTTAGTVTQPLDNTATITTGDGRITVRENENIAFSNSVTVTGPAGGKGVKQMLIGYIQDDTFVAGDGTYVVDQTTRKSLLDGKTFVDPAPESISPWADSTLTPGHNYVAFWRPQQNGSQDLSHFDRPGENVIATSHQGNSLDHAAITNHFVRYVAVCTSETANNADDLYNGIAEVQWQANYSIEQSPFGYQTTAPTLITAPPTFTLMTDGEPFKISPTNGETANEAAANETWQQNNGHALHTALSRPIAIPYSTAPIQMLSGCISRIAIWSPHEIRNHMSNLLARY